MRRLLDRLQELRAETYRVIGYDDPSMPRPPATDLEITAAETNLGVSFPPSYRAFLSIHNGWEHWSGDVALLSTREMLSNPYAFRIAKWRDGEWMQGNVLALEGLVIGFSLYVGEQIIIDPAPQPDSLERDIVLWDFEEIERYPNFYQYLESRRKIWEEEIAG